MVQSVEEKESLISQVVEIPRGTCVYLRAGISSNPRTENDFDHTYYVDIGYLPLYNDLPITCKIVGYNPANNTVTLNPTSFDQTLTDIVQEAVKGAGITDTIRHLQFIIPASFVMDGKTICPLDAKEDLPDGTIIYGPKDGHVRLAVLDESQKLKRIIIHANTVVEVCVGVLTHKDDTYYGISYTPIGQVVSDNTITCRVDGYHSGTDTEWLVSDTAIAMTLKDNPTLCKVIRAANIDPDAVIKIQFKVGVPLILDRKGEHPPIDYAKVVDRVGINSIPDGTTIRVKQELWRYKLVLSSQVEKSAHDTNPIVLSLSKLSFPFINYGLTSFRKVTLLDENRKIVHCLQFLQTSTDKTLPASFIVPEEPVLIESIQFPND